MGKNGYYQNEYKIVTEYFLRLCDQTERLCVLCYTPYTVVNDVRICEYICVFDKHTRIHFNVPCICCLAFIMCRVSAITYAPCFGHVFVYGLYRGLHVCECMRVLICAHIYLAKFKI